MITWLQRYVGKHYRWLFAALLGVVVVSFVFTFGPSAGLGRSAEKFREKKFFGRNLVANTDIQPIITNARLSWMITNGGPAENSEQVYQYGLQRTAFLHYADEMGVPDPTETQLADFIKTRRAFMDEKGVFNQGKYLHFKKSLTSDKNLGFNEAQVAEALAEDFRIEQVRYALGGPGYLMPFEAEQRYRKQMTRWGIETADLSFNDFRPEITVTDDDAHAFYEANPNRYEEGPKIKTAVIEFFKENYVVEAQAKYGEPTEQEARDYYDKHQVDFVKMPAKGSTGYLNAELKPFDDVKAEAHVKVLAEKAKPIAVKAADAFVYKLYNQQIIKDSPEFKKLLQEYNVVEKEVPPFNKSTQPFKSGISTQMMKAALEMDTDSRYFSDVVETPNGAAVMIYEGKIEAGVPPYDEIVSQVAKDCREELKKKMFINYGGQVGKVLADAVAKGVSFKDAAENYRFYILVNEASPVVNNTWDKVLESARNFNDAFKGEKGMKVKVFDDFTGAEQPRELSADIMQQASDMKPGEISPMIFQNNNGEFVYLAKREVPTETGDYSSALKELAAMSSEMSSWTIMGEVTMKELKKGEEAAAINREAEKKAKE